MVLVRKKDQDYRFQLRADDIFDRLAGAKWFASSDLLSWYYQVPVTENDLEKTAFITPDGLFEFTRMPQGVHNEPGCLMDRVLCHLKWSMYLVYLDDVWCLEVGRIPREA